MTAVPNAATIKYAPRGTKLVTFVHSLIKSLTNYIDAVIGVTRNLQGCRRRKTRVLVLESVLHACTYTQKTLIENWRE